MSIKNIRTLLVSLICVLVAAMILFQLWISKIKYMTRIAPQKIQANGSDGTTTARSFTVASTASTAAPLTSSDTITSSSKEEEMGKSAFELFGYADTDLMKPMAELRPLFNFTMLPWRIKAERSIFVNDTKFKANWSMVVIVKSAARHFDMRQAVRETWGSLRYLNGVRMERVFIVGVVNDSTRRTQDQLLTENKQHGDMLQIAVEDTYRNVGFKTLAGMQWAVQNFPPHWMYSSADDDMAPNVVTLYGELEELLITSSLNLEVASGEKHSNKNSPSPSQMFSAEVIAESPIYCGSQLGATEQPKRSKLDKWYVDEATYPLKNYPPYCHGGWYTMPIALASAIYQTSRGHRYYWMDDVWITGLLRLSHFSGHLVSRRSYFGSSEWRSPNFRICMKDKRVVQHHGSNVENMARDWQDLEKTLPKTGVNIIRD